MFNVKYTMKTDIPTYIYMYKDLISNYIYIIRRHHSTQYHYSSQITKRFSQQGCIHFITIMYEESMRCIDVRTLDIGFSSWVRFMYNIDF